jgi:hypothetical protein
MSLTSKVFSASLLKLNERLLHTSNAVLVPSFSYEQRLMVGLFSAG